MTARAALLALALGAVLGCAGLPRAVPEEPGARRARLEAEAAAPAARPEVHWELALLYLDEKGPEPDAAAALRELERYLAAPPRREAPGARALASTLRRLAESGRALEKARKANESLERDKEALATEAKALKKENQEYKQTIEKLKDLDLELENLRRKIQ